MKASKQTHVLVLRPIEQKSQLVANFRDGGNFQTKNISRHLVQGQAFIPELPDTGYNRRRFHIGGQNSNPGQQS